MNALNLYITVAAVTLGILSALLNFTGRQKYKDNASFFESANQELREQNSTLRTESASLKEELVRAQTESTQKDETIKSLIPFSDLAKIVSNNHKEILKTLSVNFKDVMKAVTERVDDK